MKYYKCTICGDIETKNDLRHHAIYHTPHAKDMDMEIIKRSFEPHNICPMCGEPPTKLQFSQTLKCEREVYDVGDKMVTLQDDDSRANVISERDHQWVCKNNHKWSADDRYINW